MKEKIKKRNFFKENYSKCWGYIDQTKWYVVASLGLFAIAFLIGFAYPEFFKDKIAEFIADMINSLKGKNIFETGLFIFFNNLKAGFFAIVFGIGLGIFPAITALINGYLLGFVSRGVSNSEGISVLWRLAPHGIFELPAVLISIGIGIKIGFDILRKDRTSMRENFIEAIRVFFFVILPLLAIAATIEAFLVTQLK